MKYTEKEKSAIINFLESNKPFHHGNSDPKERDLVRAEHHECLTNMANSIKTKSA